MATLATPLTENDAVSDIAFASRIGELAVLGVEVTVGDKLHSEVLPHKITMPVDMYKIPSLHALALLEECALHALHQQNLLETGEIEESDSEIGYYFLLGRQARINALLDGADIAEACRVSLDTALTLRQEHGAKAHHSKIQRLLLEQLFEV